jgi:hypothetical protein
MPVMIRNNDATELCITKGQEGFVAGWQSTIGLHGKRVLDTLFVELDNPPQLVKIPGLPDNIVPIVKATKTINCIFPSDIKERIERQQVWVLPNFAMTAHAAQGKTRPHNVVHLNSCYTHMSYYTALSRSATAAGTIIIQGFDPKVITKGCSGYLRQEFCEQEILDDITRLKYEGHISEHINGHLRNTLISQYRQWKGIDYIPEKTDVALKWTHNDLFPLSDIKNDSPWQFVHKSKTQNKSEIFNEYKFTSIVENKSLPVTIKHKCESELINKNLIKCSKVVNNNPDIDDNLLGLKWDADNWSCAYDSLFVIFYNIWYENPFIWTSRLLEINNEYMLALVNGFRHVLEKKVSLENVRDNIRMQLHLNDPVNFPTGLATASVGILAIKMLDTIEVVTVTQLCCSQCEYKEPKIDNALGYILHGVNSFYQTTSQWLQSLQQQTQKKCPNCFTNMSQPILYCKPPNLLIFEYPMQNIKADHIITFKIDEDYIVLQLKGIVYQGGFHFTSHFISNNHIVWYHDGMTTGHKFINDGSILMAIDDNLKFCRNRNLVLAVYA